WQELGYEAHSLVDSRNALVPVPLRAGSRSGARGGRVVKTRALYPHPGHGAVTKASGFRNLVLERLVVVVGLLLLVLLNLTVELVGHGVDGRVQIGILALDEDVLAAHVQGDFGLLLELLDRQDHAGAGDVVEVADDAVELGSHVVANGGGDFD